MKLKRRSTLRSVRGGSSSRSLHRALSQLNNNFSGGSKKTRSRVGSPPNYDEGPDDKSATSGLKRQQTRTLSSSKGTTIEPKTLAVALPVEEKEPISSREVELRMKKTLEE